MAPLRASLVRSHGRAASWRPHAHSGSRQRAPPIVVRLSKMRAALSWLLPALCVSIINFDDKSFGHRTDASLVFKFATK